MTLVRLLKRSVPLAAMDDCEPSAENTCGAVASHFEVSVASRLSFYAPDDEIGEERIAFAVAAKRQWLDDVDYCTVSRQSIADTGVGFDPEVLGETHFEDVNRRHLDVTEVTLQRMIDIAITCVKEGSTGTLSASKIAIDLLLAIDEGKLTQDQLADKLLKGIEGSRAGKGYKRARRVLDQAKQQQAQIAE